MNDSKKWYMSTTIWGIAISVLGLVNQLWTMKTGQVLLSSEDLSNLTNITLQLIGSLVAIYGRVKATKMIQ